MSIKKIIAVMLLSFFMSPTLFALDLNQLIVAESNGNLKIDANNLSEPLTISIMQTQTDSPLKSYTLDNNNSSLELPFNKTKYKYVQFKQGSEILNFQLKLDKNNNLCSITPIILSAKQDDTILRLQLSNIKQFESLMITYYTSNGQVSKYISDDQIKNNITINDVNNTVDEIEISGIYKNGGIVYDWYKISGLNENKEIDVLPSKDHIEASESNTIENYAPVTPDNTSNDSIKLTSYNKKLITSRNVKGNKITYQLYNNPFQLVTVYYLDAFGNPLKTSTNIPVSNNQIILDKPADAVKIELDFTTDTYYLKIIDDLSLNKITQPGETEETNQPFFYKSSYPLENEVNTFNEKIPIHCNNNTYTDIYVNNQIKYSKIDSISVNEVTIPLVEGRNLVRMVGYDDKGNKEELYFKITAKNPYDIPPLQVQVNKQLDAEGEEGTTSVKLLFDKDYNTGKVYTYNTIPIMGKIEGSNSLYVNDFPVTLDKNGNFKIALTLKEGQNEFTFKQTLDNQTYLAKWNLTYKPVENALDVNQIKKEEKPLREPLESIDNNTDESSFDEVVTPLENALPIDSEETLATFNENTFSPFLISIGCIFLFSMTTLIAVFKNKKDPK